MQGSAIRSGGGGNGSIRAHRTSANGTTGYMMATYVDGLRLAQRQARLARVNRQLSDFYGPLFALMAANSRAHGCPARTTSAIRKERPA
ncbi:hypothetical protein [Streptomyces virginiae]